MKVETQISHNEAITFNKLAIMYESSGDGHKALEYYTEALKIFSQIGDLDNKAIVLNNIGVLLKNHGSFSDALDCFHEVSQIMHENSNRVGEAAALRNIGTIYMNLGDFEAMLKINHQALALIQNVNDPGQESACRSGIAIALHRMGKTIEAIPYLEQSIDLLESRNLLCDASGDSIDSLRELLQTMQTGERAGVFDMIELSNAMVAFITASNWQEALQIFEQHKTLLSRPNLEAGIKEEITQMRRKGEIQRARNLQAHLSLLRRAKKHQSSPARRKNKP